MTQLGYTFPILDSSGIPTSTVVDIGDMFVNKNVFDESGLWSFGYNSNGQLGLGDVVSRSSPVQVGSLATWKQVVAGGDFGVQYGAAIKTDGSLCAWGTNTYGQLGLGDTVSRSSPVQVGSLTNWKQVACGKQHTLAIKTDGTLWGWGVNGYGNLGLGNVIAGISSPVQVGTLTNWKQVSGGVDHTSAIRTDGTMWSCGYNIYGQLGLGDVTHRSSPVQVGSLTNWKQVACGQYYTLAIQSDGSLWAWGFNNQGQLGLGDVVNISSPVQVGSLTNWKQVSVTNSSLSPIAIKTDGTLWAWGSNGSGQLGLGDVVNRSSPVQVGSLTNWKQVSTGQSHTLAIKTDGTLWAWGIGAYGNLGLVGDSTSKSSPVQVGSLTNWKQASCASVNSLAITSNL